MIDQARPVDLISAWTDQSDKTELTAAEEGS
jgi:hypothetical protein